jgi:hypothetical protein
LRRKRGILDVGAVWRKEDKSGKYSVCLTAIVDACMF